MPRFPSREHGGNAARPLSAGVPSHCQDVGDGTLMPRFPSRERAGNAAGPMSAGVSSRRLVGIPGRELVRRRLMLPVAALGCCAALVASARADVTPREITMRVEPQDVRIGFFYSGVDLRVSADVAPGLDVVVLVTGSSSRLVLQRKERVWGLFWAPAEEVTFDSVPSLYLLHSTADLSSVAPATVLGGLGVGYEALRAGFGHGRREDLFRELIRLKESEGLFRCTVAAPPSSDSGVSPTSVVRLKVPPRAPPATYAVRFIGFEQGRPVVEGHGSFRLERGAFTGLATSVAAEHGLAYGIFAVVAALGAGLVVGLLFGSVKKR
jgi:hypothetical protein